MEKFARIIVGYCGCERKLADGLLTGKLPIAEWNKSDNAYDWLGEGIYFWRLKIARDNSRRKLRHLHNDRGLVQGRNEAANAMSVPAM